MSEARNIQSPHTPVIPDKLYFRIGEVAKLLKVEAHTLRFWETEFPQLKVGKGGTGQRLYRRRDVELVLEIKQLLYEKGYTIPGARQFLQSRNRRKEPVTTKPFDPQPAEATEAPEEREPQLRRIRAELRNLSDMLTEPDGMKSTSGEREGTGLTTRTVPNGLSKPASRRGLHLATPPSAKQSESRTVKQRMLGLFDPQSE